MAEMELAGVNLPYSLDAEQSVLGAILLDGNANMPKAFIFSIRIQTHFPASE